MIFTFVSFIAIFHLQCCFIPFSSKTIFNCWWAKKEKLKMMLFHWKIRKKKPSENTIITCFSVYCSSYKVFFSVYFPSHYSYYFSKTIQNWSTWFIWIQDNKKCLLFWYNVMFECSLLFFTIIVHKITLRLMIKSMKYHFHCLLWLLIWGKWINLNKV